MTAHDAEADRRIAGRLRPQQIAQKRARGWIVDPVTQVEWPRPEGVTSARVMERARKEREGELREIRLFPEWGVDWPLWESGTTRYPGNPDDFGLSPELAEQLRAWLDFWELHFDLDKGWSSEANEAEWLSGGFQIAEDLQAEVYDFATVVARFR